MQHALTIDVEDYFQVAAFFDVIDYDDWDRWPRRVCDNTRRVLDLADARGRRGTFFILGWVAEREPKLVREIAARGHEIACHGWSHQFVYRQDPDTFRAETLRSKALLEDLSGAPVRGYRAASYSITEASRWALAIIAESGFVYDSSIFPVRHDNYGMRGVPAAPHWAETAGGRILELPLTTARIGGMDLPVAGGGYFRFWPYSVTRAFVRRHQRKRSDPFIFYMHPWEVDPAQPRVDGASARSRFRHYLNLERCERRLDRLLSEFDFHPLGTLVDAMMADGGLPTHRYSD